MMITSSVCLSVSGALKRSFDMEDVDDTPVFSPTSPLNSPFIPNQMSVIRSTNGDSRISTGSNQPLYQSRISISSSCSPAQSPVLRTRITSSLSFNRGTTQMAKSNGSTGQGLTRVSSFQTHLNPSGCSSSGHGSDSESLHSSTSSLECPPATKPFQQLRSTRTSLDQTSTGIAVSKVTSPVLKKFSSHGSVFHSEVERHGVRLVPVANNNHNSLPSLDLHIAEDQVPDLVPSPDAGYPPSEGWSSPTPAYKRQSSRNNKPVSREPSFSSSSSSSSPPTDAPISCTLASSPSPPPVFGPLQPSAFQKIPVNLQGSVGKSYNGPSSEQVTRPLPRTQLRVNLHTTTNQASHVTKEKTEATPTWQPQIIPHGKTASGQSFIPQMSPFSGSRKLVQLARHGSLQEPNSQTVKQTETFTSNDRLRSMMQRASSFGKSDSVSLKNSFFRDAKTSETSTGCMVDSVKNVQDKSGYEKSSLSTRIQGLGSPASNSCHQDNLASQRVLVESRNGAPPLNHCLQNIPQNEVMPQTHKMDTVHGSPSPLKFSENMEQTEEQITDSGLEDHSPTIGSPSTRMETLGSMHPGVQMPEDYEELGREPFGYVGIDSVLDQMRRKAVKNGFEFNIMVVGQSGLGKSTLVNTLFKSKVIRNIPGAGIPKTLELKAVSHVIEERGIQMRLTVIDTPGFGDQINNQNCWDPIIKYIHEQYEKYLREEILVNRKRRIPDSRIHSCIYFIPPTGHWLRPLDLEFMKRLSRIVNVVPVIAKSDTLTLEEREEFKQRIRKDLQTHSISVYPQKELDEDPSDTLFNDKIREKIPFAVVGTDEEHQVNGKKVLGRKTKWGIVEVENTAHCEFANLRDLLIRSNLQDLKDITHNIHYETYRVSRLNEKVQQSPLHAKEQLVL
ncbi:septin-12 isoform X2 [Bombina bombina]|uniref:septin-12 isoform X2 n=1 Tax=Bombina bombina TaxID=8345 RepID=UPI00235AAD87|nr:septin-12 isoform X2 [Bombina bombina]